MTDAMFTRTGLTATACAAGVTSAQARIILEAAGVTVQPEKPALPTEPGSVITATEVRGVKGKWRMFCDPNGDWFSAEEIANHEWHSPDRITAWTEARIVPITATVNAILAQYGAPAEDIPDWDDVRNAVASQRGNGWSLNDDAINGITDAVMRLLHREEA